MTDHFELSIMTGTRAISGSVATRLRNVVMACSESNRSASMFTSIRFAPPRTCSSATSTPPWKSSASINRWNRLDPVMFVRSPIITNPVSGRMAKGSSPEKLVRRRAAGTRRGGRPSRAVATRRMCSGVVPQQPPRMFARPASANSLRYFAVVSGCSS